MQFTQLGLLIRMFVCKSRCIAIIVAFLTIEPDRLKVLSNKTEGASNIWREAGKMTGLLLHSCLRLYSVESPEPFLIILQDCLKRKTLLAFDRMLNRDIIELADGVSLVRYQQGNDSRYNSILDLSGDTSRVNKGKENWMSQVVERLVQFTRTHVLKIHLSSLERPSLEARGRHRKQSNMFTHLMMFAMVAAGLIVIPLGFQFLAILGGKALLLAKMALLLSSIQGLKKIATSNVNYGLYSTHGSQTIPWHYDRQWPFDVEGQGEPSYSYTGYHSNDLLHPRVE